MTVTEENPSGVTSEHTTAPYHAMPEWHELARAMDEFLNAAHRGEIAGNQDRVANAVESLARLLPYSDMCVIDGCAERGDIYPPYAVTVIGGWLDGKYRCRFGHEWTCGYALTQPWMH